uniref:Uncharacterized protein n=1 Tax=Lates calcarifer TaxID=8187 RepID=A0A4W6G0S5_LATCA
MEILDSSEPFLHWDRNLSELSEAGEIDSVLFKHLIMTKVHILKIYLRWQPPDFLQNKTPKIHLRGVVCR